MFPGSFKIVGHSGTDFRNRKAFKKIKKLNKVSVFKYGDDYGQQKNKFDKKRMAFAEEKKRRKLLINGVLFICLVFFAVVIGSSFLEKYVHALPPVIVKDKYDWQIHGSESVLKNIETYQDSSCQIDLVSTQKE